MTSSVETDSLRKDKIALFDALSEAGATFKGEAVVCPFHDDKSPSGAMYCKDGIWRYKCHAASCGFCGDVFDVRAKSQNRTVGEVLREVGGKGDSEPKSVKKIYSDLDSLVATVRGVENVFKYTNPDTNKIDMAVVRYVREGKKHFLQARPTEDGYEFGGPGKPLPLYNRTRIRLNEVVIVVEGEKCVHALHEIGRVATTSPCGAGKAEYVDWSLLAGKWIYLWPDNDKGGIQHMKDVVEKLSQLNPKPEVYWIEPELLDLPEKGDCVDFIDGLDDSSDKSQAVLNVLDEATPVNIVGGLEANIEAIIAGQQRPVEWPFKALGRFTQALLPGTITIICGDPGTSKSFMLLQAAAYWYEHNYKIAIYELEENRDYHLRRALAQRAENSNLFDNKWIESNPKEARAAVEQHKKFVEGFGACIFDIPNQQLRYSDVLRWMEEQAKAGNRIIAVDPITAIDTGSQCWVEDKKFMIEAKRIVQSYDASLVLVNHPKTGRKTSIGLDSLAGGAAFPRFSQTVLWIEHHKEPQSITIASSCGDYTTEINRTVHICKARNGSGHGLSLGFNFVGGTLLFE